jgi:hypothetical protein
MKEGVARPPPGNGGGSAPPPEEVGVATRPPPGWQPPLCFFFFNFFYFFLFKLLIFFYLNVGPTHFFSQLFLRVGPTINLKRQLEWTHNSGQNPGQNSGFMRVGGF